MISVLAGAGSGPINALNVFFLTENLRVPSSLLGVLSMALGLGVIVGALLSGRAVALLGARRPTWLGLVVGGLLFGRYARQTSLVPALALALSFMVRVAAFNTGLSHCCQAPSREASPAG